MHAVLPAFLPVCLPAFLSACISACISAHLLACLPVCIPVRLSDFLTLHISQVQLGGIGFTHTPTAQQASSGIHNTKHHSTQSKEHILPLQQSHNSSWWTPNRLDQCRNSSSHIIIKRPNALNKSRILQAVREKGQVTYTGRSIRITPDVSPEIIKNRISAAYVMHTLKEHKCQPRWLYPVKLSITVDRENQTFHDKRKFTQYLSGNTAQQRTMDGKYQQKAGNHNIEKAIR